MAAITTFVNAIYNIFVPGGPDTPTGAEAVRGAISEIEGLHSTSTATLGEPDITEEESQFFNNPKVVIPIYDCPFSGSSKLVFDLPLSRNDEASELFSLLELFGLDFDTMEQLEGQEVPVDFVGGNVIMDWRAITESRDDGSSEKAATAPDGGDDSSDESGAVSVEETTISPEDTDDNDE